MWQTRHGDRLHTKPGRRYVANSPSRLTPHSLPNAAAGLRDRNPGGRFSMVRDGVRGWVELGRLVHTKFRRREGKAEFRDPRRGECRGEWTLGDGLRSDTGEAMRSSHRGGLGASEKAEWTSTLIEIQAGLWREGHSCDGR
jgi:hypothetical protein